MLKRLRPKSKTGFVVAISALLILGPFVAGLLLYISSSISRHNCDISSNCDQLVGPLTQSFGLGPLIVGPLSILCGVLLLVIARAFWGLKALIARGEESKVSRATKRAIGSTCAAIILLALYIPRGPDPCSRSITDHGYEACISEIFEGMTISEAQKWLETYGYRNSKIVSLPLRDYGSRKHDTVFQAIRSYGPLKSIPYGTNFFRLFGRIPPAPSHFELAITALDSEDKILDVEVWWAFSFL